MPTAEILSESHLFLTYWFVWFHWVNVVCSEVEKKKLFLKLSDGSWTNLCLVVNRVFSAWDERFAGIGLKDFNDQLLPSHDTTINYFFFNNFTRKTGLPHQANLNFLLHLFTRISMLEEWMRSWSAYRGDGPRSLLPCHHPPEKTETNCVKQHYLNTWGCVVTPISCYYDARSCSWSRIDVCVFWAGRWDFGYSQHTKSNFTCLRSNQNWGRIQFYRQSNY